MLMLDLKYKGLRLFWRFIFSFLLLANLNINQAYASAAPGCFGFLPSCSLIYDSWNRDWVLDNPPAYPIFTISNTTELYSIHNYHWNGGLGQDPLQVNGTISLYNANTGDLVGSWAAFSTNDSYSKISWTILPKLLINPGRYLIVDSDPATWSYSTTDYFHSPGDGADWLPGVGFSAVYVVPLPATACLFGSVLAIFAPTWRRKATV